MPEKCPVDTDRAYFCREMCQQDCQNDITVRCIKGIMFREFRKESMQRSYILANAKVIFRLVPKLYLLRKLYFDCRQSYILTAVKVIFWLAPKLRYLSITCPRRTLHFWNHVIGDD